MSKEESKLIEGLNRTSLCREDKESLMELAKSYAASLTAPKDAEIAELVDANATMQSGMANQEVAHGAMIQMLKMREDQLEGENKRIRG